jgi:hypothetical protein
MRVANKWCQIFRQQKFGGVYKQVYSIFSHTSLATTVMEYGPANDQTRKGVRGANL